MIYCLTAVAIVWILADVAKLWLRLDYGMMAKVTTPTSKRGSDGRFTSSHKPIEDVWDYLKR